MISNLTFTQLASLLQSAFALKDERGLTILVDLPNVSRPDHPAWRDRRTIAAEWFRLLNEHRAEIPFRALNYACYENVGSNNNDLPAQVTLTRMPQGDLSTGDGEPVSLEDLLTLSSVVLAPTELSATAPLKILARRLNFRGATLPGFSRAMIPALGLDYEKVNERVVVFKERLDRAVAANARFTAGLERCECRFDLRYRSAHASGGLIREPGEVANLPSGEAYIVPYEGEKPQDHSQTEGLLPVQFQNEIIVYNIRKNKALSCITKGEFSDRENERLLVEPSYGNIAELGFGVLGEWGVEAVGSILLDEKLGLHVAFGRSDHFGGFTGPGAFNDAKNVVHEDRVYVHSLQPLIEVEDVTFEYPDGSIERVIHSGSYLI